MRMRVLSCDPGKSNFAFSFTEFQNTEKELKFNIVEHGKIANVFDDLTGPEVRERGMLFQKEIRALVRKYKADYIIAERYMVRGRFNGGLAEYINIMLGLLMGVGVSNMLMIPAAQWKNRFNANSYGLVLDELYKAVPYEPHQLDAAMIGFYGAAFWSQVPFYEVLETKKGVDTLLKQMAAANKGPVKNRRIK